ncbi:MAG: flagellin [Bacillota bacterium]
MRIYHNLEAINANRNLLFNGRLIEKSQEKISSGLRINRAADDAAGLAISENMRSQLRGLAQASRNSQDAISLIQTAEGALTEVHACLNRMRELAVQAANTSYAPLDQNVLQQEIEDLKEEIDRISATTQFNNKNLLDGSASAIVSSDRATTQVLMRGGIREKGISAAGSYRLNISLVNPGTTEVLISSIFKTTNQGGYAGTAGIIASKTTKLRDVDRFYDSQGRFMLDNPQTIMLMDGRGKQVEFKIYSDDTLADVARKFNDVLANSGDNGFGMGAISGVPATSTAFSDYITNTINGGAEAVSGTFVVRSAVAGAAGKLTVIAGVDIINAFGFSEYQPASENVYRVDVFKNDVFQTTGITEGNIAVGMVHQNVDVRFDGTANTQVALNAGRYVISAGAAFNTTIHLADNSLFFQIGANELEVMNASIGLTNCDALGIRDLVVNTSENAGHAISKVDVAMSIISAQRGSLGAVQNRLEHTMNNLGVSNENITASESRIRDADMAKEMMAFTKLNILMQVGNMMLAQGNQKPQQVMQLLGR